MKKLTDSQIRFIDKLIPGQRASGVVTGFADFGAFVSIGMVSGLLHNRNIKWGRIEDPKHHLRLKQKIEVVILEVDKDLHRFTVGLKQLQEDPWERFIGKYKVGDTVAATALLRKEFGWVMEIVPGIEGLLHNSELANYSQAMEEGHALELIIRNMDVDTRKLYLGF
ncbi:MAG: S1 RNA-binding domain-containing protein [Bacteroidota bacterium]|jgi:small subunit ribosomal protein S1